MALRKVAESSAWGARRGEALLEISLAPAHPFGMERHTGLRLRSGNQQAVVLHEEDHGQPSVCLFDKPRPRT